MLVEEVRRIHQENYSVYGIRRMWHAMRDGTRAETRWRDGWRSAELICSKRIWESVREVELATMGRVHWWNTARLHETLIYRTPAVVRAACTHPTTTAPATVSPRNETQGASNSNRPTASLGS